MNDIELCNHVENILHKPSSTLDVDVNIIHPKDFNEDDVPDELSYEYLMNRLYYLHSKEDDTIKVKKLTLPKLIIKREAKRTSINNFEKICNSMNRCTTHFESYIAKEYRVKTSITITNAIVLKGKFNDKQLEALIKKYVGIYVCCKICKCNNTDLVNENRLTFVICNKCKSKTSVAKV